MGCILHKVHILSSNLARLGNLQGLCTIGICHPEWATARLTLIANHTADTDWTREEFFEQCSIVILRQFYAQLILNKVCNCSQICIANFERSKSIEGLSLKFQKQTRKSLFIENSIGTQSVSCNVIDILYKDNRSVYIVQIFEQCTVACRAEKQLPRICSKWRIIWIYSDSIGR